MQAFLEGLRQQTFTDFETIIVNSSAEEQTAKLVAECFPNARFVQSKTRLLPHEARNRAVELARGRRLVFTDPDTRADAGWLDALVKASNRGHQVVVGAMGLVGNSALERAVHLCKFSSWLPGGREGPRKVAPTANVLYTREVWNAVGAFRGDSFSSDTLHSWLASDKGFQPWFEPAAVVSHRHGGTFRSFLRERYIRGADFAQIRIAHERRSKWWIALHLIGLPAIPFLEFARVAGRALGRGWAWCFVRTIPLQLAANAAWAVGEATTHARIVFGRQSSASPRTIQSPGDGKT
jgi:GT2 family glycosyltransferase